MYQQYRYTKYKQWVLYSEQWGICFALLCTGYVCSTYLLVSSVYFWYMYMYDDMYECNTK